MHALARGGSELADEVLDGGAGRHPVAFDRDDERAPARSAEHALRVELGGQEPPAARQPAPLAHQLGGLGAAEAEAVGIEQCFLGRARQRPGACVGTGDFGLRAVFPGRGDQLTDVAWVKARGRGPVKARSRVLR
jgi:hypothetical protein